MDKSSLKMSRQVSLQLSISFPLTSRKSPGNRPPARGPWQALPAPPARPRTRVASTPPAAPGPWAENRGPAPRAPPLAPSHLDAFPTGIQAIHPVSITDLCAPVVVCMSPNAGRTSQVNPQAPRLRGGTDKDNYRPSSPLRT